MELGPRAAALAVSLLAFSCAPMGNNWLSDRQSASVDNQMMLVRRDPPTTGFRRLAQQSVRYPDIRLFMEMKGFPDFLAESATGDRRYMILYYLKDRQAFACRTRNGRAGNVEFAGPYPVTDREFSLLDGFRRRADQAAPEA